MENLLLEIGRKAVSFIQEIRNQSGLDRVIGRHGDDVTRVVDKKSEEYVFQLLNETGYKFLFVSEESGVVRQGDDYEFVALIDPLDGSTNFVSGIPWSSVSIALYKRGERDFNKSFAGVVANVFTGDVYSYYNGRSYVNGVEVTEPKKGSNVVLGYFTKRDLDKALKMLNNVEKVKIRSLGSASLDMILVCLGKAYLYFDVRNKLRNIDIAASTGFCSTLGVFPVNLKGERINPGIDNVNLVGDVLVTYDQSLLSRLF
ncbi:MAG: extragenic suppressor protein suhB [Candidatus Aramenus sulfurataquae]|uniref:D-fructose 1,6-bisphosphatase n=2 Tax=Candidatus Aramenus sulfurataquae TaxID=1326980 RepID=W7KUH7_9CREN|nr:MAG: extragenic suppressor protein suhB [Candidatus Aramenus sulfurataquae]MCL7343607.1 D-fructose 1,6-bisphosphatase [Candidatus Aramenus sulfurataquae]